MKKIFARLLILSLFALIALPSFSHVQAMCPVGFPPRHLIYEPDDNTNGLLVYDGRNETLVLEPSFHGNATEFGLVLPLPNRPDIQEAPTNIFTQLNTLTQRPIAIFEQAPDVGRMMDTSGSSVVVIEQKDVGDFTTTVLTAESSVDMINWLDGNGYQYSPIDQQNFEYYVQQGGFYFVAMKVNMSQARLDSNGFLQGKLRPIAFTFKAKQPMLPLRSMAGNMPTMQFTLYTIGADPYYIPGVTLTYGKTVEQSDIDAVVDLDRFASRGDWLLRHEVTFNPQLILEDLTLLEGDASLHVTLADQPIRVNPQLLSAATGILPSPQGDIVYIEEKKNKGLLDTTVRELITGDSKAFVYGVVTGLILAFIVSGIRRRQNYTSI